jgi:hypothetical protein
MTPNGRRPGPSILDRLAIAGLHPDLVAAFRDRRRRRTPCRCRMCRSAEREAAAGAGAAVERGGGQESQPHG